MDAKKASKTLAKSLKQKDKKPSWWVRYRRKTLINKLISALKEENVTKAWVHEEFFAGREKKPSAIMIYCEFPSNSKDGIAHSVDGKMDKKFPKYKVNIIDVKSLLPAIKDSIFKEVTEII